MMAATKTNMKALIGKTKVPDVRPEDIPPNRHASSITNGPLFLKSLNLNGRE